MGSYSWRDSVLNYDCVGISTSRGQLNLHRLYTNGDGTPVFMVHGVGGSADSFIQRQKNNAGIAPLLAANGFDVYVADLSYSSDTNVRCSGSLNQIIIEEIPEHLAAIETLRPGCPQFWLAHGFGAVLLASCYGRRSPDAVAVLGMVQIGAGRHCELSSLYKSIKYMAFQALAAFGSLFSQPRRWLPGSGIDKRLRQEIIHWQQDPEWRDPQDNFNYRAAMQLRGMPPGFYLSARGDGIRGCVEDTRLWVQELGKHDVRIVQTAKTYGNLHNYGYNTILERPEACDDHFLQVLAWLTEIRSKM